ncbi:MAG: phosphoenolpyruvate--protein phosphotransferase [Planctomycetaceae bacterium]|nr:phosphoenolpyruvate--protein phosphotransferase [Planctomycetaceae bacterium]
MIVKRGVAVSPGVAIGPAMVLGAAALRIRRRFIRADNAEAELERFRSALDHVCEEIATNERQANEQIGKQYGAIFSAHLQLARDPKLISEVDELVRKRHYSPEFASSHVLRKYAHQLQNLGNPYLAERANDLFDLERRILRNLLNEQKEDLAHLTEDVIVLAHNLTPSETAVLDRKHVLGFATEIGGATSHTAILAGALELPAIVGVGHFLTEISGGTTVILDGNHGELLIDPDEDTIARYRDAAQKARAVAARILSLSPRTAETKDRTRIHVYGNIEFPEEAEHCIERGADGIGLYRTEFLYLAGARERTEQDHFNAYRAVIEKVGDRPIVIRTLDLGADKVLPAEETFERCANPELGLRSIRLSLDNLQLFKTQLRAILRAATTGQVSVMFPLISSLLELRQAKMILEDVKEDLTDEGVEFNASVPVGIMVEVPSAALMAVEFAREVDFFSIGTNDLIQYTLAADRSDPAVAKYYNSADPAVLRLIRMVVRAGAESGLPVTVCGQMSSDPKFVPLFVGMGLRNLSATPQAVPEVKEVIRSLTIAHAEQIAASAMELDLARDIEGFLRGELKRICPDLAE